MSSRLYYIITITNRVMGSKHFLDFYRAFGAPGGILGAGARHRQR